MNLQHWIDQHPFWFAAIFTIYFLCLWCVLAATISVIGDWFALTKVYRTRAAFNGEKWKMQSGRMRWLANYNNVLTIGIGTQGLYLASMFLFRFMHPPLLIPWSDQGAKAEGVGLRVRDPDYGTRVGNPISDSWEACVKAAGNGGKLLAHRGDLRLSD
jgi:hypothetical protein